MKFLLIIASMMFFLTGTNAQDIKPGKRKGIEKIEAHKVAFITKVLDLTPEEAQKFWPLYNEYSEKERQLRNAFKANKPQKGMSEEEANNVIDYYFENEQQKLTLKKNYYDKFKMILPATKVVRLHFAENKFKRKLLKKLRKNKKMKRKMRD